MSAFVCVNGYKVTVGQALRRSLMNPTGFLQLTVENLLIRDYSSKQNLEVSDSELQAAADEFRYQLGLESIESLTLWIRENNLTLVDFQESLDLQLLKGKVLASIPDSQIQTYFIEHQMDFERLEIYTLCLDSHSLAQEIYTQITEEGENFHLLAMEYSTDEATRPRAGYMGLLGRSDLPAEVEAPAFQCQAGDVFGPILLDEKHWLYKVNRVHSARLEDVQDKIRLELYRLLVEELKSEASIEYTVFEDDDKQ
jgi:parvulin-like peptidyl-prolyl isomerase